MTNRNRIISLLTPLLLLGLWELAVAQGWLNRIFYPPPSEVFGTLWRLTISGALWENVSISLFRVGAGFVLGALPAIVLGLLMGINPLVRAALHPIAAAIYPIPKIALLPLVIVALGIGETSKIATIAVSVFFLVILNVAASVMQVEPRYFEVARSFGARGWAQFWTVALPGSLPGILASMKLGMGFALTLIVGVEFVGADDGIGHLIWQSYEIYVIDRMLAAIVVVALIGWLATVLLDELEYWVVPWRTTPRAATGRRPNLLRVLWPFTLRDSGGTPQLPAPRAPRTPREHVLVWLRAIRPWSFTAAMIPVLLGGCFAAYEGLLRPELLVLALIGSVAIQAGTNLINDYYDHEKGVDSTESLGIGDAIQRGELTPRQVFIGGMVAFAIGSLIGLYLVSVAGPFILWLGLLSVLVGYFYTAGPFALAYIGLGELAVFIFMGPVMVVGSYYLHTGAVTWPVVLASLPVSFLVAAILHANNLRDLETDKRSGKRTLATLLGRTGANIEYYVLIGGTYLSLVLVVALGMVPWLTLLALLTLPLAWRLIQIVAREREPRALHPVLQQTSRLHMQFGVLLLVGWIAALALVSLPA